MKLLRLELEVKGEAISFFKYYKDFVDFQKAKKYPDFEEKIWMFPSPSIYCWDKSEGQIFTFTQAGWSIIKDYISMWVSCKKDCVSLIIKLYEADEWDLPYIDLTQATIWKDIQLPYKTYKVINLHEFMKVTSRF